MAKGPLVVKEIASVAVVAGVPASVWTPAAGLRFRLVGYTLGVSVAASVIFVEGAGNVAIKHRTPVLAANTPSNIDKLGDGILSSAADNVLKVDVSANATVSGALWGFEE